ncbi:MAG: D-aminoacyl-tRNA deacylase [Candidatus ainarchaeum sp.]|nr:D-aminoacyl-tRNA deacylase [Candidatus ainarchaeum sp.]
MPILLFSSKVPASANIASELLKLGFESAGENEWVFEKTKLMNTKVQKILEVPTDFQTDYLIILSPHRSEANLCSLTVHIPGNWDSAEFGGAPRTLNISFPSLQKALMEKMHEKNKKYGLGFNVNYEVDHHGPTIGKSILFVEIGSTETEWKNPLAGKIIAESVFETVCLAPHENSGSPEAFFGVGGGHYAPKFTTLSLEKGFAFGHMLPKYRADSIGSDTFAQAMEKNLEKVEKIIQDKKGLSGAQKEKIRLLARERGTEILEF